MTTWKLPDPPGPEVDVLRDETGRTFERAFPGDSEYWMSNALGPGRGIYFWADLLTQRGPVTSDDE